MILILNGIMKQKSPQGNGSEVSSFILARCSTIMLVHLLGKCEGGYGEIITYTGRLVLVMPVVRACQQ